MPRAVRRDVDEDVEVVCHEAVRKDLDAGKGGRAPREPEGSDLIATVNYHSRHLIS